MGTRGTPRLGVGSCKGLGARWGTAQPRWAAHGDKGVGLPHAYATAGLWGWSTVAPGCAWGSCHPQGAGAGDSRGLTSPAMYPASPLLCNASHGGAPSSPSLVPPQLGIEPCPYSMGSLLTCGVQTLAGGDLRRWAPTLLPPALSWDPGSSWGGRGCPHPIVSPPSPWELLHLIGFVFT